MGDPKGHARDDSILISGLAILRNGVRLDYPFVESIRSAAPICDEFVVVVGKSEDDTLERVRALDVPGLRVIETEWSPRVEPAHCVLAQQTNIGMHQTRGVWCLYLQANDVLHEDALPGLRELAERHADDDEVEAMLFERLTFWADYDHVLACYPDRFKFTARMLRPYIGTHSVRDAMSMAVFDGFSTRGRWPRAVDTGFYSYRYGFVREFQALRDKADLAQHAQSWGRPGDDYFFTQHAAQTIRRFHGSHPAVMAERVARFQSTFDLDDPRCRRTLNLRERRRLLETRFYQRFGFPRGRNSRYQLLDGYVPKQRHGDL